MHVKSQLQNDFFGPVGFGRVVFWSSCRLVELSHIHIHDSIDWFILVVHSRQITEKHNQFCFLREKLGSNIWQPCLLHSSNVVNFLHNQYKPRTARVIGGLDSSDIFCNSDYKHFLS
jgi:hypothetical protein